MSGEDRKRDPLKSLNQIFNEYFALLGGRSGTSTHQNTSPLAQLIAHPHLQVRATSEHRVPTLVALTGPHWQQNCHGFITNFHNNIYQLKR